MNQIRLCVSFDGHSSDTPSVHAEAHTRSMVSGERTQRGREGMAAGRGKCRLKPPLHRANPSRLPQHRRGLSSVVPVLACAGDSGRHPSPMLARMRLKELIAEQRSVMTREMVRRAGISDYRIRQCIERGAALALTRDVIAVRGAPVEMVRAARLGARVACVSAARLMGLWVVDDGCLHVTVRTNHSGPRSDAGHPPLRLHWQSRPVDSSGALVAMESVRDVLVHVAHCQPTDLAVAVFDSALRKELITRSELERLASRVRGSRVARVVELCSLNADSGLESIARVRLLWRGITCREQVVVDGHPVDLMIGNRLIIQLDGKQHLKDPVQLARDRAQDRRLRRMGYVVLRFGYAEVMHRWDRTFAEIVSYLEGKDVASS